MSLKVSQAQFCETACFFKLYPLYVLAQSMGMNILYYTYVF